MTLHPPGSAAASESVPRGNPNSLFLKGPSLSSLAISQNQRLHEIGQSVGDHLQKVQRQELEKKMRGAGENDRFTW
jgi:5-methylcytosine-specific restriction endonuclease McrBC GTP-binding regulatory subunit McrB